jgi:uncharacterized membrane protein YuzA (DUF378 family)
MAGYWLLVIGGINWGLVGALEWNLVDSIFGGWPWLVRLIYVLVGLSAVAMLFQSGCKGCKGCEMCGK